MKIINLNTASKLENPLGLDARLAADSAEVQIVQFTLRPEEVIPPHGLPVRVFFVVMEGQGEVTIGNEKEVVSENTVIECPPGVERGWRAIGEKTLRVLAVKSMLSGE